jgi:hypothetical protein
VSGVIQSKSLSGRMLKFFRENPDEELTTTDICKKFGVTRRQVWNTLAAHKKGGLFHTRSIRTPNVNGRITPMVLWSKK